MGYVECYVESKLELTDGVCKFIKLISSIMSPGVICKHQVLAMETSSLSVTAMSLCEEELSTYSRVHWTGGISIITIGKKLIKNRQELPTLLKKCEHNKLY